MKKKYSFILLEVLLAISLVSIIAIPLISSVFCQGKSQILELQVLEIKKIANLTICEALENLYHNNPSWETITKTGKKKPIYLDNYQLTYKGKSIPVKRSYRILCIKDKNFFSENEQQEYRLLNIKVNLVPLTKNSNLIKKQTFCHHVMAVNTLCAN